MPTSRPTTLRSNWSLLEPNADTWPRSAGETVVISKGPPRSLPHGDRPGRVNSYRPNGRARQVQCCRALPLWDNDSEQHTNETGDHSAETGDDTTHEFHQTSEQTLHFLPRFTGFVVRPGARPDPYTVALSPKPAIADRHVGRTTRSAVMACGYETYHLIFGTGGQMDGLHSTAGIAEWNPGNIRVHSFPAATGSCYGSLPLDRGKHFRAST